MIHLGISKSFSDKLQRVAVFTLFWAVLIPLAPLRTSFSAPPNNKGGGNKLSLSVTITPSTVAEGEVASGTVSHNNSDTSSAVTVSLTSSDAGEATVPAEVIIPAGASTATFAITTVCDCFSDGDQLVTVEASADGYRSAEATLTVTDAVALPNVRYSIEVIPTPAGSSVWVNGLTNSRIAYGWLDTVGQRRAWIYDQITGLFYDLNQEATLLAQLEEGWSFRSVVGMNDRGDIVGSIQDATQNTKGFVLDTNSVLGQFSVDPADWLVDILPDFGSNSSYGRRINENGDVLGVYQRPDGTWDAYFYNPWNPLPPIPLGVNLNTTDLAMNNWGQIAGVDEDERAFIYDPLDDEWSWFADVFYSEVEGFNDDGVFSGTAHPIVSGRGNKVSAGPRIIFRKHLSTGQLESFSDGVSANAGFLNASGDLGYAHYKTSSTPGRNVVAHTGFEPEYSHQALCLESLIPSNDPLKATFVDAEPSVRGINDRDATTGYGQVVLRGYTDGGAPHTVFILTPFIPTN